MTPIPGFLFESPLAALVVGAFAVGVPLVIHLLRRLQRREVQLPTLRFLHEVKKSQEKKLRIEQWLLLALRCLMVALLVGACACAMPWAEPAWRKLFPDWIGEKETPLVSSHTILVMDNSLSMQSGGGSETALEDAKKLASDYIAAQGPLASFSVVSMGWPARIWIGEPSSEANLVAKNISQLPAVHTPTDLQGALALVENLLAGHSGQFHEKQVVFVSDLQRSAWSASPGSALHPAFARIKALAKSRLLVAGKPIQSNLAITSLEMENPIAQTSGATYFVARVQAFGAKPSTITRVKASLARLRSGKEASGFQALPDETLDLRESAQATLRFSVAFRDPGDYALHLELDADGLPEDNHVYAVVRVTRELDVLLVHGKSSPRELDRSAGFLRLALDDEGEGTAPVRMKVRQVDEYRLSEELARQGGAPDCILFADVPRFRPSEVRLLEEQCLKGTGLVFFAGEQIQPASYNEFLFARGKGLLPFQLDRVMEAKPDVLLRLQVDPAAFQQPPLKAFRTQEEQRLLFAPAFMKAWNLEMSPGSQVSPLAYFEPPSGSGLRKLPALLGWQPKLPSASPGGLPLRCHGWVYWFGSSANTEWNNWPAYPSFLPFVQEVTLAASAGRNHELSLPAGSPLEDFTQSAAQDASVFLPDGTMESLALEKTSNARRLVFHGTQRSGFYHVRYPDATQGRHFAVNPLLFGVADSSVESDPARLSVEEVVSIYPEAGFARKDGESRDPATDVNSVGPEQKGVLREKVAWWFLFGLLVFGGMELLVAGVGSWNRSRVSPRMHGWWLVMVALALLSLVCLLMVSLARSGNGEEFLAWMGDGVRTNLGLKPSISEELESIGVRSRLVAQRGTGYFAIPERGSVLLLIVVLVSGLVFLSRQWSWRQMPWVFSSLGLRLGYWWVLLWILLPQVGLALDKFGKPELVIAIDDSRSMTVRDTYEDEGRRRFAQAISPDLAQPPTRLEIARRILVDPSEGILEKLLKKKFRVKVYAISDRARQIVQVGQESELQQARGEIAALESGPEKDSSHIGAGLRQILQENRGAALQGIILLSDGVVTGGEELGKFASVARQEGVPVFAIGIGEGAEPRDLFLLDVQGPDEIPLGDKVVLDVQLAGTGMPRQKARVLLRDKAEGKVLEQQEVELDGQGGTASIRFSVQPVTEGRKTFEVEVAAAPGETQLQNNRMEKQVQVVASRVSKILYVEGCRRYEYHYLKMLLERQAEVPGGGKPFDLKVLLLEADPDFASQDRSALAEFPTRSELFQYDAVILGDIDPKPADGGKLARFLGDLQEFVKDRAGGLLVIAGPRFMPAAFVQTPLKDLLPVEVVSKAPAEPEDGILTGFKLEFGPAMRGHPLFRFVPDEKQNAEIWERLREMYWHAKGMGVKKGAQILAKIRDGGSTPEQAALIAQHYYGAGRVLYFGFDETWRWGYREDQTFYNQFWLQALRHLAHTTRGSISLKLDRQGNYQRGDSIGVTVRFAQDGTKRDGNTPVRVTMERIGLTDSRDRESRLLQLSAIQGSDGAYQARVDNSREGKYVFRLAAPMAGDPVPQANTVVLPPAGELEKVRMAQGDLVQLGESTRGRFYFPEQYQRLPQDLPPPWNAPVRTATPVQDVWNHPVVFLLTLGLLAGNWLVGRRLNLL